MDGRPFGLDVVLQFLIEMARVWEDPGRGPGRGRSCPPIRNSQTGFSFGETKEVAVVFEVVVVEEEEESWAAIVGAIDD